MGCSTHRIASRFLAIGGRLMIHPSGRLEFGINMHPMLALDTPESERRRLLRRTRAARRLIDRRGGQVAALIQQHGRPVSGWSVWEGR
jgi:hypothetical protein